MMKDDVKSTGNGSMHACVVVVDGTLLIFKANLQLESVNIHEAQATMLC